MGQNPRRRDGVVMWVFRFCAETKAARNGSPSGPTTAPVIVAARATGAIDSRAHSATDLIFQRFIEVLYFVR